MQEKYIENYLHYGDCEIVSNQDYRILVNILFDIERGYDDLKDDLLKEVKHMVKKYRLAKSALIFDLLELYKYDRNKYCELLKKRFAVPEEIREYKKERYLEST
jgi:hypothetical protein